MGHGRADEAGPPLAWDIEEASAGNGRAPSSVPTFLEWRKYIVTGCAPTHRIQAYADIFFSHSPKTILITVLVSKLAYRGVFTEFNLGDSKVSQFVKIFVQIREKCSNLIFYGERSKRRRKNICILF